MPTLVYGPAQYIIGLLENNAKNQMLIGTMNLYTDSEGSSQKTVCSGSWSCVILIYPKQICSLYEDLCMK